MSLVILSTGRAGSGYIAEVLTKSGVPCGHEAVFNPSEPIEALPYPTFVAESSWMALSHLERMENVEKKSVGTLFTVAHVHRNPVDVINSFMTCGIFDRPGLPYLERMMAMHDISNLLGERPAELDIVIVHVAEMLRRITNLLWRTKERQSRLEISVEDLEPDDVVRLGRLAGKYVHRDRAVDVLRSVPDDFNHRGPVEKFVTEELLLEMSQSPMAVNMYANLIFNWMHANNYTRKYPFRFFARPTF